VHTVEWPLVSFPVPAGLRADWTQHMHEQGRRWLREAQEAAELAAPGVPTQVHLFTGDPRTTLVTEAEQARALVVGSRGFGVSVVYVAVLGFHRSECSSWQVRQTTRVLRRMAAMRRGPIRAFRLQPIIAGTWVTGP
jgi:hypothetical protein